MNSFTVNNFTGNPHQSAKNGWGRYIMTDGSCMIGWWNHDQFTGNGRYFNPDSSIREEGWFEYGLRKENFRVHSKEYRYWDMKQEYFLSNGENLDQDIIDDVIHAILS